MTTLTEEHFKHPDQYPELAYPVPRRMGQFSRLQLGGYAVVPGDLLVTRSYFGLRHTDTWFNAWLTSGSGQFTLVCHNVWSTEVGSLSAAGYLGAMHTTDRGMVQDDRYEPWTGAVTHCVDAEGRLVYAPEVGAGGERVCFDAASLAWTSVDNRIALTGQPAGGGTQWLLPWREPSGATGAMFYCQHGYSVVGFYLGEPVTGHLMVETSFGSEPYRMNWWRQHRVGHWAMFAVDYDDGSSEFGQFLCGEYAARGAVVVDSSGREVVNTTNINARDADGVIEYELGGGERWRFDVAPDRTWTVPAIEKKVGFGRVTRVGEARGIVKANAAHLIAHHMPAPEPSR